ncbi:alpha-amylase family glycosyl hydrolase [Algoriphagus namhaensis]
MKSQSTFRPFEDQLVQTKQEIWILFQQIYGDSESSQERFGELISRVKSAFEARSKQLRHSDRQKSRQDHWFLSNQLCGMSLYVDRFAGSLRQMPEHLDYLQKLGVNVLHLMPIFESPAGESDGGYAVSDYRKVDSRFGSLEDLKALRNEMQQKEMLLMLDIVLNHTSHRHEWAEKAKSGDKYYQDFYYMYDDRWIPNQLDESMPEIFPESSPGNFTYVPEIGKWVMTVFHHYQWDLNFMNPNVLIEMVDHILFYGNLGVDILRIDAPAFIWKKTGTTSQNLPEAHTLLRLIKHCVQLATPGMALLGEAIVSPKEIMKYFGTEDYLARECDFAYNATHMALQWDMLATADTRVMLASQHDILQKPQGVSWINYTRCHDDIGLGYEDGSILQAGKDPFAHRNYLKEYYSGRFRDSPARGALFSSNPKTGDARISGTLASLCGLEKALIEGAEVETQRSIQKILLMQAHAIFLGGLPMLYYGDEVGYTNDYSYEKDPSKSYDNRWMHRPRIDWEKNRLHLEEGTVEQKIYTGTQKLLAIRKTISALADQSNLEWMSPHHPQVAGYLRQKGEEKFIGVFNFGPSEASLTWYAFREKGLDGVQLLDHWSEKSFTVGKDEEHLVVAPYGFHLFTIRHG